MTKKPTKAVKAAEKIFTTRCLALIRAKKTAKDSWKRYKTLDRASILAGNKADKADRVADYALNRAMNLDDAWQAADTAYAIAKQNVKTAKNPPVDDAEIGV